MGQRAPLPLKGNLRPQSGFLGREKIKKEKGKNNNKHKRQSLMKEDMHLNAKPSTFGHAKKLRRSMTPAEIILWSNLRKKQLGGFKFRRQHPISRYVLDFYCHQAKLGIELDGAYHFEKTQKFYDEDRTENLALYNIEIIRFENKEVTTGLDEVLRKIKIKCEGRVLLDL